jgi:hypothetical protein
VGWRAVAACLLLVLAAARPAAAQAPASDGWDVTIAPYLMGAAITGTTGLLGVEVELDVSASDIFENLEFGAMGMLAARKGRWGVGGDVVYMGLGAPTEVFPGEVDFNQTGVAVYGLRQLAAGAELTFGARVNGLDGAIDYRGPVLGGPVGRVEVEQSKWWVDPLVGVTLRTPGTGRLVARVYTEIGGFGVGSDFVWQVFPILGIRVGSGTIDLGYRWLDVKYVDGDGVGRFTWDTLTQGPVAGFTLRF